MLKQEMSTFVINDKTYGTAVKVVKKWLSVFLLVVVGFLSFVPTVSASQRPPSGNPTIPNVWAFQGLYEPDDELYLAEINIPDPPSVELTASQTFIVNLMNGTVTLAATTPITNPYGTAGHGAGGYGRACIGLYFSANDVIANGMVWSSTNYTMNLLTSDNSSTTWNGTAPTPYSLLLSSANWYSTNPRTLLRDKIIYLANQFKSSWETTAIFISSGILTSEGETYFTATIPNLRIICPIVFSGYLTPLTYYNRVALSVTYALTLRNQWATTWVDLSPMAADWGGLDVIWFYAGLWMLVILAVCIGFIGFTSSNEGIEWLVALSIIVGGLIGFLPYSVATMTIVVSGLAIYWSGFYKKTVQ